MKNTLSTEEMYTLGQVALGEEKADLAIINQEGKVHKKVVGYRDKAFFEKEIRQLLAM